MLFNSDTKIAKLFKVVISVLYEHLLAFLPLWMFYRTPEGVPKIWIGYLVDVVLCFNLIDKTTSIVI